MEIRALGENTYLIQIQSPPDDFKPTKMEIARREKYQAMNDLLTLFPIVSQLREARATNDLHSCAAVHSGRMSALTSRDTSIQRVDG